MEDTKLLQLDNVTCTERVIGQGAYGRVLEVSTLCAAKEIHHALVNYSTPEGFTTLKQKFLQECAQCMVLCHPNIVHFQGIHYPTKKAQLPWLVMEKMDYSLNQYLESHEPTTVSFQIKMSILHDVSLGLQYLHAQDIIHRDLSSNNVLVNKQLVAKIADLGVAKVIDPNHAKSATRAPGTAVFMPPEALSVNPRYGKPVDVFSFGCVTIHVMTHVWPIPKDETHVDEATGKKSVLSEVERRDFYLANIQEPVQLKELIFQCLQDSPKHRPSVNDICKVLKEVQPDLKISKIQSILLDYEPLLEKKEEMIRENEKMFQSNKTLIKELDKLDNELAVANESIDCLHREAEQQADKYHRDLCKAEEEMKIMETTMIRCKEDFDQERKEYQNQLQMMRNEMQQHEEKFQELESQIAEYKAQREDCRHDMHHGTANNMSTELQGSRGWTLKGDLANQIRWDSKEALGPTVIDPNMFVAKYTISPNGPDQLALKKGDKIRVKRYNDSGDWCEGETDNGAIGWIPTLYIVELNSLEKHSWYHGLVSRTEAEYRLSSGINGSFLVRESESNPGQFSISLRYQGRTYHYLISNDDDGNYYAAQGLKFKKLSQLVYHHSNDANGLITTLCQPAVNLTKPPIHSLSHEVDKWEVERSDLEIGPKLSLDRHGDVYKAKFKLWKKTVAVKTFKEVNKSAEEFLKEASVMKRLKHPHLVQLLGVCTQQMPFFIIMEYMEKGNLQDFIQGPEGADLQPVTLVYMAQQIAHGMAYLEKYNIIHRDLTAHNCLVGENHLIKVAEFGLSRLLDAEIYDACAHIKFPIKWTAPEGLAYHNFSTKSDVWSFGVVLWELTSQGKSPYPDVELSQVFKVLENGYQLECPVGCPRNIYSMMKKCWTWEENDRPTFKVLYQELCELSSSDEVAEDDTQADSLSHSKRNLLLTPCQ
ncbi:tyrosine-protein kinase Abl-like isoform X2 [Dysidea avara]|uniref:tyrosine-protein kinase Abl-like isoform X2 n=1 Tax=Dysidea avara TaxID=196820 RepID=UPI003328AA2F